MGLDHRIGSKFLHPGVGYGGSCFPKDTEALIKIGEKAGVEMRIVKAAVDVNRELPQRAVEKLRRALGDLHGKTICLLGLAFKPNTDDVREAPALKIHHLLRKAGASVRAFDPVAMERVRAQEIEMALCGNAYEAMQGCDALMLVTEWNEFRTLDLGRMKSTLRAPIVVDCRNIYNRERMQELGFRYDCFGS
jgi:UDPglucose 6-dehydrogenase